MHLFPKTDVEPMSWTFDLPRLDTSTTVNSLVQLIIQLMGHMIKKSNSPHTQDLFRMYELYQENAVVV